MVHHMSLSKTLTCIQKILLMGDLILKYSILWYHAWNFWYQVVSDTNHDTSILIRHTHLPEQVSKRFNIFNWICIKFHVYVSACIMSMPNCALSSIGIILDTRYQFLNYWVSYRKENYWYLTHVFGWPHPRFLKPHLFN